MVVPPAVQTMSWLSSIISGPQDSRDSGKQVEARQVRKDTTAAVVVPALWLRRTAFSDYQAAAERCQVCWLAVFHIHAGNNGKLWHQVASFGILMHFLACFFDGQ